MGNFEIKPREILFSIIILAVWMILGFLSFGKLLDYRDEEIQKYNTAVQIENPESFSYAINTKIGNILAYGNLMAVDVVSCPEIEGEYMYIEKCTEQYMRHTRRVKRGERYRTETYYTWDVISREDKHCEKVSFLDEEFKYDELSKPAADQIGIVNAGYHLRYVFNAVQAKYTGTLYINSAEDNLNGRFYDQKTIKEFLDWKNDSIAFTIIFWVIWLIVGVLFIIGFFYLDNNWLDD